MAKQKQQLTAEEKQAIVEEIIGVHPKFLQPHGAVIKVLVTDLEAETQKKFRGFPDGSFPAKIG